MDDYKVEPGTRVRLSEWDPNDKSGFDGDKETAEKETAKFLDQLDDLQELLYAEHKHKVLIVLQAMDTGGKDGVIRHVFRGVNPQGVRVASFKAPTQPELDHDFLWRIHAQTPGRGEIVIFNRSHYEDVLVVRVHHLVPDKVWRRRYDAINNFEKNLADEGTTILKFYLNIDQEEQKRRLQDRLDDPTKHWKFNPDDLSERKLWADYMRAYEDVLSETSRPWAPWYIVPANRKWYRNVVLSRVIVETLKALKMAYPPAREDIAKSMVE